MSLGCVVLPFWLRSESAPFGVRRWAAVRAVVWRASRTVVAANEVRLRAIRQLSQPQTEEESGLPYVVRTSLAPVLGPFY